MQAQLLSAALPYMQRYENKHVVVKYGGHAMGNPSWARLLRVMSRFKQSGVNPHRRAWRGPQIQAMLTKLGIESRFEGGLRVTDEEDRQKWWKWFWPAPSTRKSSPLSIAEGEWAIGLCGKR